MNQGGHMLGSGLENSLPPMPEHPNSELVPSGHGPPATKPSHQTRPSIPDPPSNGLQLIIDDVSLSISDLNVSIKSVDLKVTNLRLTVSLQLDQLMQGLGSTLNQTVGGVLNNPAVGGILGKELKN